MKTANLCDAKDWFSVLQQTGQSQTAVMTLEPGAASGDRPEAHAASDQVLLLLEGRLAAEVGDKTATLNEGDSVIVPAGVPHRFVNTGTVRAITFNVYTPPAY